MRVNHIKWNEEMEKRCMSVFAYACKNTDNTEATDNFVVKEECIKCSLEAQHHVIKTDALIEKDCLYEALSQEQTAVFDEDNDANNSRPNESYLEEKSDNSDFIMSLFLTKEQEDACDDLDA